MYSLKDSVGVVHHVSSVIMQPFTHFTCVGNNWIRHINMQQRELLTVSKHILNAEILLVFFSCIWSETSITPAKHVIQIPPRRVFIKYAALISSQHENHLVDRSQRSIY